MTKEQLAKLGIVVDKDLTDDEAFALIEKHNQDLVNEKSKLKNLNDKYSSEIAGFKKKEQDRMSDDEKKAMAQQELENELKTLRRENVVNKKVGELMEVGYGKELATKIAEAEIDGKSTAKYHQEFITAREESLRAELLAKTPKPDGTNGTTETKFTKENFSKGLISMEDMNKLRSENPTLYNELISSK